MQITKPTYPYILIGTITNNIAKESNIQAGNIYITLNQLKHIKNNHGAELEIIGMRPIDYVKFICQNFNQIRQRPRNGYMLVVYNKELPHTAIMELNFALNRDNGFWEIKTAEPRRNSVVIKSALIWEAAKHTSSGCETRPN